MPPEFLAHFCALFIPLAILAAGQVVVGLSGGIDLSIPGVVSAAAAVGGWAYAVSAGSLAVAVAAMIGTGAVIGAGHGWVIAGWRQPAWLVTALGLAVWSSFGSTGRGAVTGVVPTDFGLLASPLAAWMGLAGLILLLLHLGLHHLVVGRWVPAVGADPEGAWAAGVPVGRVVAGAHGLSGGLAGIAAVFLAGRSAPAPWRASPDLLLDVLGAAVLGGALGSGGRGRLGRAVIGAGILAGLSAAGSAFGVAAGWVVAAKAGLVLAAVAAGRFPARSTRTPGA